MGLLIHGMDVMCTTRSLIMPSISPSHGVSLQLCVTWPSFLIILYINTDVAGEDGFDVSSSALFLVIAVY